jgi:hypothetical protein
MKVDELWKNDNTLLEINTGSGKPNAFLVYNRKKSFNDGTREKGDQVTVVQQSATSDNESEMLGGLDAGQSITIPGTSIVVKVCGLDSEATFDFAKVSVYDTSLGQSSNCNVALNTPTPQVTKPTQATFQPAQQVVKPAATQTQTIVTQNSQQAQVQNRPQQQLPQQEGEEEVCYLRDIGQVCCRDRHCCSGKRVGTGWNQKCVA